MVHNGRNSGFSYLVKSRNRPPFVLPILFPGVKSLNSHGFKKVRLAR